MTDPFPGSRWLDTRAPVPEHLNRTYPGRHLRRIVTVLGARRPDGRLELVGEWQLWEPDTGDWRLVNRRGSTAGPNVFERSRYQRMP